MFHLGLAFCTSIMGFGFCFFEMIGLHRQSDLKFYNYNEVTIWVR